MVDRIGEKACDGKDDGPSHDPFSFFRSWFGGEAEPEEEQEKKGDNVMVDVQATLEELCVGEYVEFVRHKVEKKSMPGTRKCNCRLEMKHIQLGPGSYQMVQEKVCSECPNYK